MPKNDEKNIAQETPALADVNQTEQSMFFAEFAKFIKTFNGGQIDSGKDQKTVKRAINQKLVGEPPISVAFPDQTDVLLSLIKTSETDEITAFFNDYFVFCDHSVMAEDVKLETLLDPQLRACTGKWFPNVGRSCQVPTNGDAPPFPPKFPPFWCFPTNCVELSGGRHLYKIEDASFGGRIRRLFVGDLVWLYYFDRMGIFKILGAILDDYAIRGNLPISNGSVNASDKDDLISIVLEAMVRETKTGLSSTVRDRNISYRRGLGWIQEEARQMQLDTVVNTAFTNLFHKFIQTALEFYKDKRLATAITGINSSAGKTSVATLTAIKDTIDLLKRAFDAFNYGRNYTITLSGIVWVVAGMALIREMRSTLGIPSEYKEADEFIPAAYDLLVGRSSARHSEANRYDVHRDCAENARAILLDLEAIDIQGANVANVGGDLEIWLDLIEGNIEGYRTAYRSLTGVDLGAPGTPTIEQQA